MNLAQRNSDPEHWKNKYLNSLDDLEVKEQSWTELEGMLRRAIARLALAGYGDDPKLDRQLDRLRDAVKRGRDSERVCELATKASDLSIHHEESAIRSSAPSGQPTHELKQLIRAIELPKQFSNKLHTISADLDKIGTGQPVTPIYVALSELLGEVLHQKSPRPSSKKGFLSGLFSSSAEETVAETLAPSNQDLLLNLILQCNPSPRQEKFSAELSKEIPAEKLATISTELSGILSDALQSADDSTTTIVPSKTNAWLMDFVDKLSFPQVFEPRLDSLKEKLENPLDITLVSDVLTDIATLVAEVQLGIEAEKTEIEDFLKGVTDRLQTLDEYLRDSRKADKESISEGEALRDSVRNQVSNMRSEMAEADNLAQLKASMVGSLDTVESHIGEYLHRQTARYAESQEQIRELDGKLQEMHRQTNALKTSVRKAREEASRDMLTGLSNRRSFDQRFSEEYARCRRYSQSLSMVILDIDHFKKINDNYGHKAGDKALKALAGRIVEVVRISDFTARYGGEEFVILMPETSMDGAFSVAEKLRGTVASCPFHYRSLPVQVTVSCGIGELNGDESEDNFFKRVDDALYTAKSNGRNQCCPA